MNRKVGITTVDNPYNQFDDFTNWFLYDTEKGYYTSNAVARLTNLTDDMTQLEEDIEVERAIDRLIEIDPFDLYTKVENNK